MNQAQFVIVEGDSDKRQTHAAPAAAQQPFVMRSPSRALLARGVSRVLPAGMADTLGQRVREFFKGEHDGPALLVGALPFDRLQHDSLLQPQEISAPESWFTQGRYQPPHRWQVTPEPSAMAYSAMVSRALEVLQRAHDRGDDFSKVVLARSLKLEADQPVDVNYLAARMAHDPAATTFVVPLPPRGGQPRSLVGATPELLVAKSGRMVRSNPLAGSAKRQADAIIDRHMAASLLASEKDQREHAMVVEAILDNLAPYCDQLQTPSLAQLQATASMWHLGTQIEGRLRDPDVSSAELAACLHPTPAVAGSPRDRAQALIRELEPFDRGFYAGAVGWTDGQGDGEWYVSLRCGEVCGNGILLYAGAGIVLGSDPEDEAQETSAKFLALLRALGIDEQGRTLHKG